MPPSEPPRSGAEALIRVNRLLMSLDEVEVAMAADQQGDDEAAMARSLVTLIRRSPQVPLQVAAQVQELLDEMVAMPIETRWWPRGADPGFLPAAKLLVGATRRSLAPIETLSELGLREAAWFKASDAIFYLREALSLAQGALRSAALGVLDGVR